MAKFRALLLVAIAVVACAADERALLEQYDRERAAEAALWRGQIDRPVTIDDPSRMQRVKFCQKYSPHDDCERFIRENIRLYYRWKQSPQ